MILSKGTINTTDVKKALEVNSNDVGALCTSINIKPWAKYKPVNISENPENPNRNRDWWKSNNGSCGFVINRVEDFNALANMFENSNPGWIYKPVNPPYRLADFRGYDNKAIPPITASVPEIINVTYGEESEATLVIFYNDRRETELKLEDISTLFTLFNNLGEWYVGFVYKSSGDSSYRIVTSTKLIKSVNDFNEIIKTKITVSDAGVMTVYPIMCSSSYSISTNTLHRGDYIIPLPNTEKMEITIKRVNNLILEISNDSYFVHTSMGDRYQFICNLDVECTTPNLGISGNFSYRPRYRNLEPSEWIVDPIGTYTIHFKTGKYKMERAAVGNPFQIPHIPDGAELVGFDVQFTSSDTSFSGTVFNILERNNNQ